MNSSREEMEPDDNALKEKLLSKGMSTQDGTVKLRAQVDAMIEHWFTDMWLLVSDDDRGDLGLPDPRKDRRALAMAYQGQLHLLESKPSALNALRSVGILMKF